MSRMLQLVLFCALAAKSSADKDRSIFVIGPTGSGKSSLGNRLTYDPDAEEEDDFGVSGDSNSTTTKVAWRKTAYNFLFGGSPEPEKINLVVSDSPGLSDTHGRTTKFLDHIIVEMRASKPNGIIFVIKSDKKSRELALSLRVLRECLGSMAIADVTRVALFVNQLPNQFQLEMERPAIRRPEKQTKRRLDIVLDAQNYVSTLLGLEPKSFIRTVIGNIHGQWDGLDAVKEFVARMPDTPMDLARLRTWSEVKAQAQSDISEERDKVAMVKRRIEMLKQNVKVVKDNIAYYKKSLGANSMLAGWGTFAVASGTAAALFVPGLNAAVIASMGPTIAAAASAGASSMAAAVSLGTAATAGALSGGIATSNVVQSHGLDDDLLDAKKALMDYIATKPEDQVKFEVRRLEAMLEDVLRLEADIDKPVEKFEL